MKCGLEIHQRLSGHKLFCSCLTPAPDAPLADDSLRILRKLTTAASELGQTDVATSFEGARERSFEYAAPPSSSCLVETDEEPPHAIDAQSLSTALQLAHAVGAHLVDEIQVMRKTVIDGSNTSGFQRTSLVSLGGQLATSAGPIPIQTICLEEESAGILPPVSGRPAYRLDRLGIPLLEIATDPVFTTPDAARAGAEAIGLALRMMPRVMRGLGTIRQDVNISIPGGARVEIKGAQSLDLFTLLIENEMARQQGLIDIYKELDRREKKNTHAPASPSPAHPSISLSSISWIDATDIFSKTECKIVSRATSSGARVLAAKLPHHAGLLGRALYPNRRYGTELSDYAKAAGGVSGLLHSDEDLAGYRFSPDELEELVSALECGPEDAFILIADLSSKAEPAMRAALSRAAVRLVPGETRKALDDGGSSFMRPLAGEHRMYPETDIEPIRLTSAMLLSAAAPLESAQERRVRLVSMLGPELGEQMLNSHQYPLFMQLITQKSVDPKLAASMLEQTFVALRREGLDVSRITLPSLTDLLRLHHDGRITRAVIPGILRKLAQSPAIPPEEIVKKEGWSRRFGDDLLALWKKEGGELKSFMSKYRLVVEGADLAGLAKKK